MKVKKILNIVFIFIALAGLIVPLCHISKLEKSPQENRMLAQKPQFVVKDKFNKKFGDDFNRWLSDRFWGRGELLRFYQTYFDRLENDRAFLGDDNWLFFKEEFSEQNFQNAIIYSEKELANITKYFVDINEWCQKNNIKFYFFIAPDKNKVYGEYFKKLPKIRPDSQSRANQLVNSLVENGVNAWYQGPWMLEHKDEGFLYDKNDTHWNSLGAYVAYRQMMQKINRDIAVPVWKPRKMVTRKNPRGDLTGMLPMAGDDQITEYRLPQVSNYAISCTNSPTSRKDTVCTNPEGHRRVVVFRDSYTSKLSAFLNMTFAETSYFWRHNLNSGDLSYIKEHADILLFVEVERSINKLVRFRFPQEVSPDAERP